MEPSRSLRCCLLISLSLLCENAPALEINVDYTDNAGEGFKAPDPLGSNRKAAFEYAISLWKEKLEGPIAISVQAEFNNFGTAALGRAAVTTAWANLPGFPEPGWGFVSALASQLNNNPNLGDDNGNHLFVEFNTDYDLPDPPKWYYETNGLVPPGRFDLPTTALHEIAHGLGFVVNINPLTGAYQTFALPLYIYFLHHPTRVYELVLG